MEKYKIRKSAMFLLMSFLSFFGYLTFAKADGITISTEYSSVIMDSTRYTGVTCSGNPAHINYWKDEMGNYRVQVKEGSPSFSDEVVRCSFTLDRYTGTSNATNTFRFSYTAGDGSDESGNMTITTHLYKQYGPSIDMAKTESLMGKVKNISNAKIVSGHEYIDLNCGGSACIISMKEREYTGDMLTTVVEFDVELNNGATRHVTVNAKLHFDATIYATYGGYGTCDAFGSGWTQAKDENGNVIDGKMAYKYKGGTITLPNCRVDNDAPSADPLIEFKGWNANSNLTSTLGTCAGDIPGGSSFAPGNNIQNYSTCYVKSKGIKIAHATVTDGGWNFKNGIYYRKTTSNTITLPNGRIDKEGRTFIGWKRADGTSISTYKPGDEVAADGATYYPTWAEESGGEVHKDIERTIYLGNSSIYALSGISFTSCSSADSSKVSAVMTGGQCKLTALQDTGDNRVIISASDSSGNSYMVRIKVISTGEGNSEGNGGSIQTGLKPAVEFVGSDPSASVNPPAANGNKPQKNPNGTSTVTGVCGKYRVSLVGKNNNSFSVRQSASASWQAGHAWTYKAVADASCDNAGAEFLALCLDPGRQGPGAGANYNLIGTLANSGASPKFANFIAAIYKNYLSPAGSSVMDANNATKIAALVAVRVASFKSSMDSGLGAGAGPQLKGAHAAFQSLAASCTGAGSCNLDDTTTFKWQNTGIKSTAVSMMAEYFNASDAAPSSEETVTFELTSSNYVNGSYEVKGKVNYPADAELVSWEAKCPAGVSCSVEPGAPGQDFTFRYTLADLNAKLDATNLGIIIKYKSSDAFNNVFLLQSGSSLQRMIIFNSGDNPTQVFVPVLGGPSGLCNIADYQDGSGNITGANLDAFLANDCCDQITDENDPVYMQYCSGRNCLSHNYSLVCDVEARNNRDTYDIHEARDKATGAEKYALCVVDVAKDTGTSDTHKKITQNLSDAKGNKYAIDTYNNNKYCRVTCKEDWQISTPGFNDFVGVNAVLAGSYFQINEDVYFSGTRTCVTTYIDYDKYLDEQEKITDEMVKNYNEYSERSYLYYALYDDDQDSTETNWNKESKTYNWYVTKQYTDGAICGYSYSCSSGDLDGDSTGTSATGPSCKSESTDYKALDATHTTCASFNTGTESGWEDNPNAGGDASKACRKKSTSSSASTATARTCWRVEEAHKNLNCNIFSIKASANSYTYDKYNNGNKYGLTPPSTEREQKKNSSGISEKTNHSTGGDYNQGDVHYSDDFVSGYCETDSDKDGTQNGEDIFWYRTYLLDQKATYGGENLKSSIINRANTINASYATLKSNADQFNVCQGVYLKNTSGPNAGDTVSNSNFAGVKVVDVPGRGAAEASKSVLKGNSEVANGWDVKGKYTYEESEYMNMLGGDNVLEINREGGDPGEGSCTTDSKTGLEICRNSVGNNQYYDKTGWTNDSQAGKAYAGTAGGAINGEGLTKYEICVVKLDSANPGRKPVVSGSDFAANAVADCSLSTFNYYQTNYIKTSMKNSAIFSNKGYWYLNMATDVKKHGDSKDVVASSGSDELNWSKLGTNHNTFPIKVTTRRNIYQYVYSFADIGYYSNGSYGRVMGNDETSLVDYHTHACFYEVKEELCKCCGSPIVATTEDGKTLEDYSKVDTEDTVPGYSFSDRLLITDDGTLGFFNSTVSLNDLDSGTGRQLANNWSDSSHFFYVGENLTTSKGSELANYIEKKGEDVYNETPEYSYTLNPSALAKIKGESYTYGFNANSIETQANWVFNIDTNSADDDVPKMAHYKSKYLQSFLKQFETPEYQGKLFTDLNGSLDSCIVSNASDLKNKHNCRWVDYKAGQYRLAFK